jgi:hypothetical protein
MAQNFVLYPSLYKDISIAGQTYNRIRPSSVSLFMAFLQIDPNMNLISYEKSKFIIYVKMHTSLILHTLTIK